MNGPDTTKPRTSAGPCKIEQKLCRPALDFQTSEKSAELQPSSFIILFKVLGIAASIMRGLPR